MKHWLNFNESFVMRRLSLLSFLFLSLFASAQRTDKHLQKQIADILKGFHGTAGVYVHDLSRNKIVAINADTIFPTASMIKIPIGIGIMHKISRGDLQYHQVMTYTDSLYYSEGEDILASFKSGEKISLSKLLMLMLSTSDNAASLWLQGLAGGGVTINSILDSMGMKHTRVNSRTPGREENRSMYGWGQTTPKEMAGLMEMVADEKIINQQISDRMLRMMGRQYWDEEAISQIPPNVFVADKNGAVDSSRSEVMYVKGAHPYILCISTKNNKDTSWDYNNEAWTVIRKLSALLWNYYNPGSKWQPASPLQ